jgi:glycosyltransferase involved in cell wall biosynthesis
VVDTLDRPLVTFAVLAFNQEKFVRKAIEGAFAQTFRPLDIILSDDGSSDRTFEVMREMAAAYAGPHSVRVRRNDETVGIIDHVITLCREAKGELVIMAAGDDISYAGRAASLWGAWQAERPLGVYSNYDEVAEDGGVIRRDVEASTSDAIQSIFEGAVQARRYGGRVRNVPGFAAAYSRRLFADLPLTGQKVHNEDALSTYLINLMGGGIAHVPETLMAYRLADASLSARLTELTADSIMNRERKISFFAASTVRFVPYLRGVARATGSPDCDLVLGHLEGQYRTAQMMKDFWERDFPGRLRALLQARRKVEIMFILPRLFGQQAFVQARLLASGLKRLRTRMVRTIRLERAS